MMKEQSPKRVFASGFALHGFKVANIRYIVHNKMLQSCNVAYVIFMLQSASDLYLFFRILQFSYKYVKNKC